MDLKELGWNEYFEKIINNAEYNEMKPARVVRAEKNSYILYSESGEIKSRISGRMSYEAKEKKEMPAVGDWVLYKEKEDGSGIISKVIERRTKFSRKQPISGGRRVIEMKGKRFIAGGITEEQIVASNIDTAFIVIPLDDSFDIRKIERYSILVQQSGADGVILLSKLDLCQDIEEKLEMIRRVSGSFSVEITSSLTGEGIDNIRKYIKSGITIALLGSSGVGKSTLINKILGNDEKLTGVVREKDSKGKHTTTWRELVMIPGGGIIIDNPGMRELQLWSDEEHLDQIFNDVISLINSCVYSNCSHTREPGCAVREAIKKGELDEKRYENYINMKFELEYLNYRNEKRNDRKKVNKFDKKQEKKRSRKENKIEYYD